MADLAPAIAKHILILTALLGGSLYARASDDHVRFCEQMTQVYAEFKWPAFSCPKQVPKLGGKSIEERPLLYWNMGIRRRPTRLSFSPWCTGMK